MKDACGPTPLRRTPAALLPHPCRASPHLTAHRQGLRGDFCAPISRVRLPHLLRIRRFADMRASSCKQRINAYVLRRSAENGEWRALWRSREIRRTEAQTRNRHAPRATLLTPAADCLFSQLIRHVLEDPGDLASTCKGLSKYLQVEEAGCKCVLSRM